MKDLVGAVLVVGGGIAGIQSSLDLADSGFKVYLAESLPSIGGKMAQLDKTFPTNDCSMCILAPKMVACSRHPNIEIMTYSDIVDFKGEPGNFSVTVNKRARFIDESKCIGCGTCAEKCPVRKKVFNKFNENLEYRRAAYRLFPQAIPSTFLIDKNNCIFFKTGKCKACEKFCPADAVDFEQKDELITLNVGSVIISSGMGVFNPSKLSNFGYGIVPDVVTSIEFERILSASGPYGGHILRPSDKVPPKKIAFIQCVGSRDRSINRNFCSAACCMYAIKEAIIAKEHEPDLDITIYYMDIRAFGKDFEKYYENAKNIGIKFIRSRPTSAQKHGNQIKIIYEDDTEELKDDLFDLVVLSVGFQHNEKIQEIDNIFNLQTNEFGFTKTDSFNQMKTNTKGVFACGINSGPKDIPETVTQASAAAGCASALLAPTRGKLVKPKELPEEIDVRGQPPRIGVFICHCGINIGSVVDVPNVVEYAKTLPNVVIADESLYTCSADSQNSIKEKIKEYNLNRVVIASCTPRTHEPLFQETIREAGLNRHLFEMCNIREQDSWVHMKEPEKATQKAKELVRMATLKANKIEQLQKISLDIVKKVLVIGGGIAGITAALEAEKQGYPVYLIEKKEKLGGLLNQIHILLDDEDPQKYLADRVEELNSSKNIQVFLNSELIELGGFVGNFKAKIKTGDKIEELDAGAVIIATGGELYKPIEYFYGKDERIVTGLEFEKLMYDNQIKGKTFCFIQCVGSRNDQNPYCNRICCSEAVKNAIKIKEKIPDSNVFILYRDLRVYGLNEKYYGKARDMGVFFINYEQENPPEAKLENGVLTVEVYDKILKKYINIKPDNLILSVGIDQRTNSKPNFAELSQKLKVPLNKEGFFLEAHMKLRPVDFATDGIFLCGTAHWPKLIPETISQAIAAVSRASTILSKDSIETEGIVARVNPVRCTACGLCVENCPYNAIELQEVRGKKIAVVNEALCKGCGTCSANCRCSAVDLLGFTDEQISLIINSRAIA